MGVVVLGEGGSGVGPGGVFQNVGHCLLFHTVPATVNIINVRTLGSVVSRCTNTRDSSGRTAVERSVSTARTRSSTEPISQGQLDTDMAYSITTIQ